jgi:CubicO group peptidase (beta-lactamase class C family)
MVRAETKQDTVSVSSTTSNDVSDKLKTRFKEVCQDNKFMGTVSITVNGTAVFSAACGLADAQWNVKSTTDTRFLIGSITKEFTAAAVLLLYQEKKLEMSDPIGKYLPDLPKTWQPATIHQLLTHTSGIPIYTATEDGKRINPELDRLVLDGDIPNQLLDLVRDRPLLYGHGEKFTYNNSGYILLGMLIEKVSGISYSHFIQQRIFDRLQMHDSGYADPSTVITRLARGYRSDGPELRNENLCDPRTAWSAGVLYSTVGDLTRWSEAMSHNELLNADVTERVYGIYPKAVSEDPHHNVAHYGYGVVLTERFGHQLQYHGGGIRGFHSVLQRYPEKKLVLAVLSNLEHSSIASWDLADSLAKIWFESE